MKKLMALLVAMVMGTAIAGTVFAEENSCSRGTAKTCAMKMTKAPKEAKDIYACPMCPGVTSDTQGKCPKCGMNLEKKQPAVKAKAVTKKAAKAVVAAYSCPMHPGVTSEKAGKCPECGMFLEKK